MKKLFVTCLTQLIVLTASATIYHDAYIDGIYYKFSGTEASVTYNNEDEDGSYGGAVVIPSSVSYNGKTYTVTSIGDDAFYVCDYLTSVSIPSTVTSIGSWAFRGCERLTSLNIPASVTQIYASAFKYSGLTSIVLPEGITKIWYNTFEGCWDLASVTIPSGVTEICDYAFAYCDNLTSLTVGNTIPVPITENVFTNRSNATLYVPSGCKVAYENANYWKEFKEIVELPGNIDFADANVKAICLQAWDTDHDGELSEEEAAVVTSLDQKFKGNTNITLFNELRYFTNLTTINPNEFNGCSSLVSVVLPENIRYIYDRAFCDCSSLASVQSGNHIESVGLDAFKNTKWLENGSENGVKYLGNFAAAYDMKAKEVRFRDNTTGLAKGFFRMVEGLSKVELPASVSWIPNLAFYRCQADEVVIPDGVTGLSHDAFGYAKIGKLTIQDSESALSTYANHDDICGTFSNAVIGTVTVSRPMKTILQVDNDKTRQYAHPFGKTYVEKAVITCDMDIAGLFDGCSLGEVVLPNNLSYIGNNAFRYDFSNSNYVYGYVYYGWNGNEALNRDDYMLREVSIPASVSWIGNSAFEGYSNLVSVTVKSKTPATIYSNTFSNSSKVILYVPVGSKASYEAADYWKDFREIVEIQPVQTDKETLSVEDVKARSGSTVETAINLTNESEDLTAYQFDLILPDGISLGVNDKGKYVVSKTSRYEDDSQTLNVSKLEGSENTYRFVCFSMSSEVITGTSGAILNAALTIRGSVNEGSYEATITNIVFTKTDGTQLKLDDAKFNIVVNNVIPGDVNGDGEVNVADLVAVSNYMAGDDTVSKEKADVNSDGEVNVADLVAISNIMSGNAE
jgi:hypothetical protein